MKHIIILIVLVLLPAVALGQEAPLSRAQLQEAAALDERRPLHVTDLLFEAPEGRAALRAYHDAKVQGGIPAAAKTTRTFALDDTASFNVITDFFTTGEWVSMDFILKDTSDDLRLWVELGEWSDGRVTEPDVEGLMQALVLQTPAGSYDPARGIKTINEEVFGEPPNIDGDGIVDVLLYDITEGSGSGFIAGLVSPVDADPNAPAGQGNRADVLYLDTNPTISDPTSFGSDETFVQLTAAHEYQHLIHLNYDTNEGAYVNEGLSEWAEVLMGYPGRTVTYLNDPDRYTVPFLRFVPENSSDDRQRGALFTNYWADRFGVLAAGSIARDTGVGATGYRQTLASLNTGVTLEELLLDFHVATFLNDTNLDPHYGFSTSQRLGLRAAAADTIDARTADELAPVSASLPPGSARYVEWLQVEDLQLVINIASGQSHTKATALLFDDGVFEARPLDLTKTDFAFAGHYDRLVLVLVHAVPDVVETANVTYSATWNVDQLLEQQIVQYDNGVMAAGQNGTLFVFNNLGSGSRQANRFVRPPEGILKSLSVAPFYEHEVEGSQLPFNDPRDYEVQIRVDDGAGFPGEVFFSLEVKNDLLRNVSEERIFTFRELDVSVFQDELAALPDTFYVGLVNAGEDANHLVMGLSEYTFSSEHVSYLYLPSFDEGQGAWRAFPQISGGLLNDTVLPIRASFLVPEGFANDNEDIDEVPDRVTLHPNYPNPFNPTTTIRYSLPQATQIKITVFDVLGRQIATLIDGLQKPGQHQVQVDAHTWASGVYFYTLEASGQRQTHQMMLIK